MTTDFRDLLDLASERLGGTALYANDEFFAEKENLLKPHPAVWKEHEYTDRGKWMDGWESRRKRVPGFDFCIIRLGLPGILRGVVVDTAFFRGNYPDSCSIEACHAPANASVETLLSDATTWVEVLGRSQLEGNSENLFGIESPLAFTHIRLNIFPDGGVARLRVHGTVVPNWKNAGGLGGEVDLAAAENGAEVLSCSDMFFGSRRNLTMPGRAKNMSDGWETKRRRGPGFDWAVLQLATEGTVRRVEVDTNHFKGNYPDTASIEGALCSGELEQAEWRELLPRTKLEAHTRHFFIDELLDRGPFTHLRLNVFPDGGVSRLRVHGVASGRGVEAAVVRHLNSSPALATELMSCCGSRQWVARLVEARPFASWEELTRQADEIWWSVGPDAWMEAFLSHPRIGERKAGRDAHSRWSTEEQAKVDGSLSDALVSANREYDEKFGFLFIVCASGKSGEEMLEILRSRLPNDRETELRTAAEEQRKIMHLRLRKLVTG